MMSNRLGLHNLYLYPLMLGYEPEVKKILISAGIMTKGAYDALEKIEKDN